MNPYWVQENKTKNELNEKICDYVKKQVQKAISAEVRVLHECSSFKEQS